MLFNTLNCDIQIHSISSLLDSHYHPPDTRNTAPAGAPTAPSGNPATLREQIIWLAGKRHVVAHEATLRVERHARHAQYTRSTAAASASVAPRARLRMRPPSVKTKTRVPSSSERTTFAP